MLAPEASGGRRGRLCRHRYGFRFRDRRSHHFVFQAHFRIRVRSGRDAAQIFGRHRGEPHDVRNQYNQHFVFLMATLSLEKK